MCHSLFTDSRLFTFIQKIDDAAAAACVGGSCAHCGGRLDRAFYARKPRGLPPDIGDGFCIRPSFCCRQEDCRRRHTPVMLRFLDRRVYASAIVVLVAAMCQGVTPVRLSSLRRLLGVAPKTMRRWLRWWREFFPQTPAWLEARAAVVPPVDDERLPLSLYIRLVEPAPCRLAAMVALLKLVIRTPLR